MSLWRKFRARYKTPEEIMNAKKKLSILYAFLGWNTALVVLLNLYLQNSPIDLIKKREMKREEQGEGIMHVVRFKGLHLHSTEVRDGKTKTITIHDPENKKEEVITIN